jgi:hypothetical protein
MAVHHTSQVVVRLLEQRKFRGPIVCCVCVVVVVVNANAALCSMCSVVCVQCFSFRFRLSRRRNITNNTHMQLKDKVMKN